MEEPTDKSTHQISKRYAVAQTVILFTFAVVFFLDDSPAIPVPGAFETVGTFLCAIGLVIMLSAFASIRGVIQIAPEPRLGGKLVTSSIYKRLRHPIYTGILILVVALFFRKPTVPVIVMTGVVMVFLVVKARFEEKLLLMRYPEYAEYQSRTWGIVLRLRRSPKNILQGDGESIKIE